MSHIRDDTCKLPCEDTFTIDDFQSIIDIRGTSEISIGNNITPNALYAKGQQRQEVGPAVKIPSNETADVIEAKFSNDPRMLKVGKMCRTMHNGYKAKIFNPF